MRMTRQRKIILSELQHSKSHPTASELYHIVQKTIPSISLGTIYRNLNLLTRQGHIKKLKGTGNQCRFDGDLRTHFHMRCSSCNSVEDIYLKPGFDLASFIKNKEMFEIHGYNLELFGICSRCQKKSNA